jgi:hypothetical protein
VGEEEDAHDRLKRQRAAVPGVDRAGRLLRADARLKVDMPPDATVAGSVDGHAEREEDLSDGDARKEMVGDRASTPLQAFERLREELGSGAAPVRSRNTIATLGLLDGRELVPPVASTLERHPERELIARPAALEFGKTARPELLL